jgi:hypothetical protein
MSSARTGVVALPHDLAVNDHSTTHEGVRVGLAALSLGQFEGMPKEGVGYRGSWLVEETHRGDTTFLLPSGL